MIFVLSVPLFNVHAATYSSIKSLQAVADGTYPYFNDLTQVGSKFYGMTYEGGSSYDGVLFSINADGTGYTIVHTFIGGASDGAYPLGNLTVSGSKFYGMLYQGGTSNDGVIFSMNIDGTGFTILHSFTGGNTDGEYPYNGSLVVSNSVIYGMALEGGTSNQGVIFSMNTDGTGFTVMHSFTGGATDGQSPYGDLLFSGSTLYGMTYSGGTANHGTVFSIDTNGTGFTVMHSFTGGVTDGLNPYGGLVLSNTTLFGTTSGGGTSNAGIVFSMGTDGTGFTVMHSFAGGNTDGSDPTSQRLALSGSTLYGMTYTGGTTGEGVAYSIDTDGSNYNILHSFTGGATDGSYPYSNSLIVSGSNVYGLAYDGGTAGGGVIFSMKNDGTSFAVLHSFTGSIFGGESYPYGNDFTAVGSTLYGTTEEGGTNNDGVVFSVNTDGTNLQILHSFTDTDGGIPTGNLIYSNSTLYGMAYEGGANNQGDIFSINTDGTGFTVIHSFDGGVNDGSIPYYGAGLTLSNGKLYGTTSEGGGDNDGVVFSINTDGTGFTVIHSFTGGANDGNAPYGGKLTISGSKMYGTTYTGGTAGTGTLFSMNTDGTGFTILHSFTGGTNDGYYPYLNDLTLSGTILYGDVYEGGANNQGIVYSINTDGTGFTILHSFSSTDNGGYYPVSALTLLGSTLYGVTYEGGSAGDGTVYSMNTDGTGFTVIHSFTGVNGDGTNPITDLALTSSGLYGMTYEGGAFGEGTLFSVSVTAAPTVTTGGAMEVSANQIQFSGDIVATGGVNPTEVGVNYGLTPSYGTTATTTGSYPTGGFSLSISGLACGKTYYYRAFAVNTVGTGEGGGGAFTTNQCAVTTLIPTVPVAPQLPASSVVQPSLPSANTALPNTSSSVTPEVTLFTKYLKLGVDDPQVLQLQQFLDTRGFPVAQTGWGSLNQLSTTFGQKTKKALALYQATVGIPNTGYFGSLTKNYVNNLLLQGK